MKEIHEFRIWDDTYYLLSKPNTARYNGFTYVLKVERGSPEFDEVGKLDKKLRESQNKSFFSFWEVKRKYSSEEVEKALLFQVKLTSAFEPTGEECGTTFDETVACKICGSNRKQIGPLRLRKETIPKKKDISRTIAGDIVVSQKFREVFENFGFTGISFGSVLTSNKPSDVFQLRTRAPSLEFSNETIAGKNIFDLSTENVEAQEFVVSGGHHVKCEKMVLKCPLGHLIGPTLISEAYVRFNDAIRQFDFFESAQKIGVKQGLLRPEPVYFCSPRFRKAALEEGLKGIEFEIAHVVGQSVG